MTIQTMIEITANGQSHQVEPGCPLPAFLEARQLSPKRVVIEYNGQALTPAEALQTTLREGDTLEIVRIVAGG